jgi:subtilisin family serine protease
MPLDSSFNHFNTGLGAYIYVVDTGVVLNHEDFLRADGTSRVIDGFQQATDGFDDGRGAADCNGHGTHCASTAAGKVYGVAKEAPPSPVIWLGVAPLGKAV